MLALQSFDLAFYYLVICFHAHSGYNLGKITDWIWGWDDVRDERPAAPSRSPRRGSGEHW